MKTEKPARGRQYIVIKVDKVDYELLMMKFDQLGIKWAGGGDASSYSDLFNDIAPAKEVIILYVISEGNLQWRRMNQLEISNIDKKEVITYDQYKEMGFPI